MRTFYEIFICLLLLPLLQSALTESSSHDLNKRYKRTPPRFNNNERSIYAPRKLLKPSTPKPLPPGQHAQYHWETLLLHELFTNRYYNNEATPSTKRGQPIEISIELFVLKIDEVIEVEQEIILSGFLKLNWTDVRLTWNPKDFGGLEWIVCSASYIWLPDVGLINSNDIYQLTRDQRFPVTISHNGRLLYVPAGKIRARCELKLGDYPWDQQNCMLRFESWMYPSSSVRIVGNYIAIDHLHFISNPQWHIANTTTQNAVVQYEDFSFSRVDFHIILERKALFQVAYTIFPCLMLSILQICSHILPFHDTERVTFATTALMSFAIFHVSIVDQMPQTSDEMPVLALYIDALMVLIVISLLECFICLQWIGRVGNTVPRPFWWWLVVENIGRFAALGSSGDYWRRRYLIVYERSLVQRELDKLSLKNTKIFEQLRKQHLLDKIASVSTISQSANKNSPEEQSSPYCFDHRTSLNNQKSESFENFYLEKLLKRFIDKKSLHLISDKKSTAKMCKRRCKDRFSVCNEDSGCVESSSNCIEDIRGASPSTPLSPLYRKTSTMAATSSSTVYRPPSTAASPFPQKDADGPWQPLSATHQPDHHYCSLCGTSCNVHHQRGQAIRPSPSGGIVQMIASNYQPHSDCLAFNNWRHGLRSFSLSSNSSATSKSSQNRPKSALRNSRTNIANRPTSLLLTNTHKVSSSLASSSSSSSSSCFQQQQTAPDQTELLEELARFLKCLDQRNWEKDLQRDCHGVWKTFITVIDQFITAVMLLASALLPVVLFMWNNSAYQTAGANNDTRADVITIKTDEESRTMADIMTQNFSPIDFNNASNISISAT